jgi:hypothetical protein
MIMQKPPYNLGPELTGLKTITAQRENEVTEETGEALSKNQIEFVNNHNKLRFCKLAQIKQERAD